MPPDPGSYGAGIERFLGDLGAASRKGSRSRSGGPGGSTGIGQGQSVRRRRSQLLDRLARSSPDRPV